LKTKPSNIGPPACAAPYTLPLVSRITPPGNAPSLPPLKAWRIDVFHCVPVWESSKTTPQKFAFGPASLQLDAVSIPASNHAVPPALRGGFWLIWRSIEKLSHSTPKRAIQSWLANSCGRYQGRGRYHLRPRWRNCEAFRLPQPRAAFTGDVPYGRAGESRSGSGDHASCQDGHDPLLLTYPAQSETCCAGKSASTPDSCGNAGANAGAEDDSVNAKWFGNLCIMMSLPHYSGRLTQR
jgi:hypothetical protein